MALDQVPVNTGEMQGGGQSIKKICKVCGFENTFIVPKYEIVNSFGMSMLVFPHPEAVYCEKCNKAFQLALIRVDAIAVGFVPIKDPRGQLVTAPAGSIPPYREN